MAEELKILLGLKKIIVVNTLSSKHDCRFYEYFNLILELMLLP